MNIATTNKNNIDIDPSKMVLVKKITSQVPTSFIGSSVHIVNIYIYMTTVILVVLLLFLSQV